MFPLIIVLSPEHFATLLPQLLRPMLSFRSDRLTYTLKASPGTGTLILTLPPLPGAVFDEMRELAEAAGAVWRVPTVAEEKKAAPKRPRPKSRPQRWADACAEAKQGLEALQELQEEYREWQGSLPENLQASALADKLSEIDQLDVEGAISTVDECEGADLPLGFGRD